ncbi:hypothetical protein LMG11579_0971 [Bifidobacterium adolescentis]|nr:hypothetical protein LMG11579_0971 [Bifidobacterium adolescentis]
MTYAYFPAYSEGTTEKQQKIQRQENNEATSRATQKKTKEEDRRPSERKHHEERHLQPDHQRQPRLHRPGLRPVRTRQGLLRPDEEGPQQVRLSRFQRITWRAAAVPNGPRQPVFRMRVPVRIATDGAIAPTEERSAAEYGFRPVGQLPLAHAHGGQDRLASRRHRARHPCHQRGKTTKQFQIIVLVEQVTKILDGLIHVLVGTPIVSGAIAALVMCTQVAVEHQPVEDAVQSLDRDTPRPVMRVRIQTSETLGDRQPDGRGLNLKKPHRLAEGKIVGQHPHNGTWPSWSSMQWRIYALPP